MYLLTNFNNNICYEKLSKYSRIVYMHKYFYPWHSWVISLHHHLVDWIMNGLSLYNGNLYTFNACHRANKSANNAWVNYEIDGLLSYRSYNSMQVCVCVSSPLFPIFKQSLFIYGLDTRSCWISTVANNSGKSNRQWIPIYFFRLESSIDAKRRSRRPSDNFKNCDSFRWMKKLMNEIARRSTSHECTNDRSK